MSAQVALVAHLNALLDNAAKDRAEEAPEAWANLEKIVRLVFCFLVTLHFISWGSIVSLASDKPSWICSPITPQ